MGPRQPSLRALLTGVALAGALVAGGSPSAAAGPGFRFRVPSLSGGTLSHEDFKGKIVVVDVWATWCGPCRMIVPHLVKLSAKYRGSGVAVVGLSADSESEAPDAGTIRKVESFVREHEIPYPIGLMNPGAYLEVGRVMGTPPGEGLSIPTTIVLGRNGRVLERYGGYFPGQEREIDELIAGLLAAETAPAPRR